MASLPADLYSMKDSPSYQPILRAILKSQIQLLVEQLCETGEETLILTANARDGLVDQLGSNYGKQFVEVYDDFKAEFLGFCQKMDKKRKQVEDSPQQGAGDAKKARQGQVIIPIRVTKTGSGSEAVLLTPENVPKVSSARVITRPKQTPSQPSTSQESSVHSTPSIISTIEQSEEETISEEDDESQDPSYTEMEESTDLGYENVEEIENWDSADVESSISETERSQSVQSAKVTREGKTGKREKTTIEKVHRFRPFVCNICKKPFATKWRLKIHSVRHGEKKERCGECGKMFFTKTELKQHDDHVHKATEPIRQMVTCELCGKTYNQVTSLYRHYQMFHEQRRPYKCEVCHKTFGCNDHLKRHALRHGEKTLQCSKCAKMFFTDTELKQHENFCYNSDQKKPKPRKTDSGIDYEKMFSKASSCPECGKLFIRRDQIELHMLTHTGQYPHVCHICGQGYRKKNSYVIHMKKKHPNEVLESE